MALKCDDDGQIDDKLLHIWKRRKKKIKWTQGKGIKPKSIFFAGQDTIECVIGFRIDNRTIKRENL